ncbi:hypothetical protein CORC01_14243 [Colletotrichum orchidophilum]|uniref:Uncharacterized protein n=1 Tax=Colletotrichum orchidophilum TaxID=1209926 RepID=A0A1G4AMQ0_9PEZI|nr:uncharacterized protein CORC01_14243 [Colletotrichum orchidophilum]OHE90460.1 hypothetical protein CORC01_14243 [Colletotrichum orchidophilum]
MELYSCFVPLQSHTARLMDDHGRAAETSARSQTAMRNVDSTPLTAHSCLSQ